MRFPWLAAALFLFAEGAAAQSFAFATADEGRAVLGARDDYVRAMAPLERSYRLRTNAPVSEDEILRHMAGAALEWSAAERALLEPHLAPLERFAARLRAQVPRRILLVLAADELEDRSPHTRANAIMLPRWLLREPNLAYVLAHELFHVVSRADPAVRERLYAALGFERCASVELPPRAARLRISNPDAPESRHTIAVRNRHFLPWVQFGSGGVPQRGFLEDMQVAWLPVERAGDACRATEPGVDPQRLEGLRERVGRNTAYLLHPEEILADNFAFLYLGARVPSPQVLERMREILLPK